MNNLQWDKRTAQISTKDVIRRRMGRAKTRSILARDWNTHCKTSIVRPCPSTVAAATTVTIVERRRGITSRRREKGVGGCKKRTWAVDAAAVVTQTRAHKCARLFGQQKNCTGLPHPPLLRCSIAFHHSYSAKMLHAHNATQRSSKRGTTLLEARATLTVQTWPQVNTSV